MKKEEVEKTCEAIMEQLLKDGYSYQVTDKELESAIWMVRGVDRRTAQRWTEIMLGLNYIKESGSHPIFGKYNKVVAIKHIYELNVVKIPELFKLLKRIPQTHLSSSTHTQISTTTKRK